MSASVVPHQRIVPRDYDVFVGLDVDKTSISMTVQDHSGRQRALKMPYDTHNLLGYVRNHLGDQRVAFAYEAGPTGYGLYDALISEGRECLVVSPASIPTAPNSRVKTNRLDSKKIAEQLCGGQLQGIRVPTHTYRELRHLGQLRNRLAARVRGTKAAIKGLLLMEGLAFPPCPPGGYYSEKVLAALAQLPCSPAVRFKLDRLLEALLFFQSQKDWTRRELVRMCKSDPDTAASLEHLLSVPGIGETISCYLIARVGDWRLLRSVDELGAYCGLVPTEHSTGEREDRGSITRCGDATLRSMIIQGAWRAIVEDAQLRDFYHRVASRHPRKYGARIAIVAVARKLTMRMYVVLTQRRHYIVRSTAQDAAQGEALD
jgi:transposase